MKTPGPMFRHESSCQQWEYLTLCWSLFTSTTPQPHIFFKHHTSVGLAVVAGALVTGEWHQSNHFKSSSQSISQSVNHPMASHRALLQATDSSPSSTYILISTYHGAGNSLKSSRASPRQLINYAALYIACIHKWNEEARIKASQDSQSLKENHGNHFRIFTWPGPMQQIFTSQCPKCP